MKLLITADYNFIEKDDDFYANIPWDARFYALYRKKFSHLILLGIVTPFDKEKHQPEKLFKVDSRYFSVRDMGPIASKKYFLLHFFTAWNTIRAAIKEVDAVCIKMFYVTSILTFYCNFFLYRKPLVSYLVGNAVDAFKMRKDLIKNNFLRNLIASRLIKKILLHVQNHASIAAYVSYYLKNIFQQEGKINCIVANESWLQDTMYLPEFTARDFTIKPVTNLLFAGRLIPLKGVMELLEAFTVLNKQYPLLTLTYVGDGPLMDTLKAQVNKNQIGDKVFFPGWIPAGSDALFAVYRKSDILILPSHAEGLPLVLLEAMANGVAVVATNISGIPEIVINRETGLLINRVAAADIETAVQQLIADNNLFNTVTRNAYELSRQNSYNRQRGILADKICGLLN